jgi:hypothetical protein
MEIIIKYNEIKSLSELKDCLGDNISLKIDNIKWVDVNGNELDKEEYKFYNIISNDEFDLDYIIENCDYNDFRRIDLMVEQLEEYELDLFVVLYEMINDYYSMNSNNPNVSLSSFEFKLFSYQIN